MTRKLYFIKEIVLKFGIGEWTIRKAIDSGKLKASKIGREWRVKEEDFEAYLEATSNINKNRGAK